MARKRKRQLMETDIVPVVEEVEGRLFFPRAPYFELEAAELKVKLAERTAEVAKFRENAFRDDVFRRLPPEIVATLNKLQEEAKKAQADVGAEKKKYREVALRIEGETRLKLAEWLIDDNRELRRIEPSMLKAE